MLGLGSVTLLKGRTRLVFLLLSQVIELCVILGSQRLAGDLQASIAPKVVWSRVWLLSPWSELSKFLAWVWAWAMRDYGCWIQLPQPQSLAGSKWQNYRLWSGIPTVVILLHSGLLTEPWSSPGTWVILLLIASELPPFSVYCPGPSYLAMLPKGQGPFSAHPESVTQNRVVGDKTSNWQLSLSWCPGIGLVMTKLRSGTSSSFSLQSLPGHWSAPSTGFSWPVPGPNITVCFPMMTWIGKIWPIHQDKGLGFSYQDAFSRSVWRRVFFCFCFTLGVGGWMLVDNKLQNLKKFWKEFYCCSKGESWKKVTPSWVSVKLI